MKNPLATLLIATLVAACTLEPDEIYFNHAIEQPNPTGFISLNNFDQQDTIYLYRGTDFTFNLGIDVGKVDEVEVRLGGSLLYSGYSPSGKFSILGYNLKTGTFKLTIQFIADAQSGSLANKLGAEKYQLWRSWVVVIDIEPPPKPVLNITKENGFLKLTWTPYSKPNFNWYDIEIEYNYNKSRHVRIKNSAQAFWYDSSYVGGYAAKYRVITNAFSSRWSDDQFTYNPQELKSTYRPADSTVFLTWRKSRYSGAFKNYSVLAEGENRIIENIDDTTYTYRLNKVVFQQDAFVSFNVNPKYPFFVPSTLSNTITNTAGASKLRRYTTLHNYIGVIGKFIGTRSGRIIYFNNQFQEVDSVQMTASDFNSNFASPYVYYSQAGTVAQLNLNTKETKKSPLPTGYVSGPTGISGASNGLAAYANILRAGNFYSYRAIYDFANEVPYEEKKSVIISTSDVPPPLHISGQGKYLYSYPDKSVYKINGATYSLIGTLPSIGTFFRFREDNNEQIIVRGSNTLSLIKSDDLTLIRTITAPAANYFIMYDPATHYALFARENSDRVYLINIDTQVTKVVNAKTGSSSFIDYKLIGGYLFAGDGSYLKVL